MPAYNEEQVIARVVEDYYQIVKKIKNSEIIVVNDCSTDNTLKILQKLTKKMPLLKIITLKKNSGHGIALLTGLRFAVKRKKDYVFHVDSDNQFNAKDFWKLYKYRNKYNLISGYRQHRKDPFNRKIISKILKCLIFLRYSFRIKDANSPFKLIERASLKKIMTKIPAGIFAPSIFMQIIARKLGMKTLEIPVRHYERKTGKQSVFKGFRWKDIKLSMRNFSEIIVRGV